MSLLVTAIVLVNESGITGTQIGKHNRSVMVAVYGRLVLYHPVNGDSNSSTVEVS
jgi:hypothetical protein